MLVVRTVNFLWNQFKRKLRKLYKNRYYSCETNLLIFSKNLNFLDVNLNLTNNAILVNPFFQSQILIQVNFTTWFLFAFSFHVKKIQD